MPDAAHGTNQPAQLPPPTRRYCAFISYRHADNAQEGRRWAEWLHRALERYIVPPDLAGTTNDRGELVPASLYPLFRDEDELPANADLATGIRAALEVSEHLIVLCSPRSAMSPWVRKEVREFKELGRSDRILAVMIAGEPNADDPAKARDGILPEEECFCEELRFGVRNGDGTIDWSARTEPLAADLRPGGMRAEGFVSADAYREHLRLTSALSAEKIAALGEAYHARLELGLLKVTAGLLGVPLGQLTERDAAYRAALAEKEAARQREIAERERQSAERERLAAEQARRANTIANRRQRILMVVTGVTLCLGVAAAWLWQRAMESERTAQAEKQNAVTAQKQAEAEKSRAEEALVKVEASEKAAEGARDKAVTARRAADELIRYMQYDLRDTLEKVGRLSLIQSIDDRIARYRKEHPPEAGDLDAERERGVMLQYRGDVLRAEGKLAEALRAYTEHQGIAKRLVEAKPDDPTWQRDLSVSYCRVGDIVRDQGQLDSALDSYRQFLAITERLAKADPDNADFQHGMGVAHGRIGSVLLIQGDVLGALKEFRERQSLAERLVKADAGNLTWQHDLSLACAQVGDALLDQGQLDAALESYRQSLAIRERLAKADPDNAEWQRDLAVSYNNVGGVLRSQGQLAAALESYRQSLTIRERLAKADPDNAGWQRDLANSYQRVGGIAQRQERCAEAAVAFARVVGLARPWLDKTDAEVRWMSIFAFGAGSCWEVLRDAPAGTVTLDRAQVVADLRTARDRLRQLKEQGRLVPQMDKNLPWIEGLLAEAEAAAK